MEFVEPAIIAGQVQLNVKVISVHSLVCFRSCGHVQLQHTYMLRTSGLGRLTTFALQAKQAVNSFATML